MRTRIDELDALRGIAALSVVLFHFTMDTPYTKLGFNIGSMGIDLFFVISGFVIFMSIERSQNWRLFAWNRVIRLYPAYWACVTLTTLLTFAKSGSLYYQKEAYEITNSLLVKYLANMTMFQYYFKISNIDGPYWTLSVELVFYIFIIFVMVTRTVKYIEQIGLLLLLLCSFYALDAVANNYFLHKLIMLFPLMKYFPLFYAGIILYKMKFERVTPAQMAVFGLTLLVQCLLFTNCYRNTLYLSLSEYVPTLAGIYAVFLLFLFNKLTFIVNTFTRWLGKISYSLYLIHQFVGGTIIIPGLMKYFGFGFVPACATALALVLALAQVVNKFVEKPAMAYFKSKTKPVALMHQTA